MIARLLRLFSKPSQKDLKRTAELAYKENSKLLRELQFQKYALDEHAIVSVADAKGNISYVNDKFCAISGYLREELVGNNHRILKSDEHPSEMYRELWHTITQGKTWHGELKNFKKNGEAYWVDASIVPFMDEHNKPFQYVAIRTDITKFKELEKNLQIAVQQAEAANQAKSEFLSMMSHEIRTPMHCILGMTDLLIDTRLSAEQQEYLNSIYHSSQALLTIINDILDFSKIEAGKLKLDHQPFDLVACTQESINLIRPIAEEKSLNIYLYGCPYPKYFIGDANRIRQILINLLGNAVKFTSRGFINVQLSCFELTDTQAQVQVIVEDTGIGISSEAQKKLFAVFSQADVTTTRKFGGTGLGLAISKKLVELMHGQISVSSEEGKGSRFCFNIPLPLASAVDIKETQNTVIQNKHAVFPQFKGHVLLVEDILTNQKIAESTFKKLGLSVAVANNGLEALQKWQTEDFDLIFMDCLMPIMDGYETTRKIRASETAGQHIPILALTASVLDMDKQKCLKMGMDDVLAKPFSKPQLIKVLSTWLETISSSEAVTQEAVQMTPTFNKEPELARLDHDCLLELKEALAEGFTELIHCYLSEAEQLLSQLNLEYKNDNLTEIKRIAHSIKSSSANVGALKLSALAASLETQANEGLVLQVEAQIKAILAEFLCVKVLLENLLDH